MPSNKEKGEENYEKGFLETHKGYNDSENVDDGYTYTLGGNYTFDCGLKVMAFGQYFENQFIETPQGNI